MMLICRRLPDVKSPSNMANTGPTATADIITPL
jgi:hypothetical protein